MNKIADRNYYISTYFISSKQCLELKIFYMNFATPCIHSLEETGKHVVLARDVRADMNQQNNVIIQSDPAVSYTLRCDPTVPVRYYVKWYVSDPTLL